MDLSNTQKKHRGRKGMDSVKKNNGIYVEEGKRQRIQAVVYNWNK